MQTMVEQFGGKACFLEQREFGYAQVELTQGEHIVFRYCRPPLLRVSHF